MKDRSMREEAKGTWLFIVFLGLIFWLPLPYGSNRPWAWHLFEVIVFVLLFFWLKNQNKLDRELPRALKRSGSMFYCLGGFALLHVLQLVPLPVELVASLRFVDVSVETSSWVTISIDKYSTWSHLRTTLALMSFAFLVLALVNTTARLKALLMTVLAAGTLQSLYGSVMTLSGIEYGFFVEKEAYQGFATGTFWNRNHFANYLVLCLTAGIALLLSQIDDSSSATWRQKWRKWLDTLTSGKLVIRICLALMVIGLVLSKSRMGNASFFVALTLAGFIWLILTKRFSKGAVALLVSLLLVDTLILGTWFGLDEVKERLETTSLLQEGRDEVNRDTWTLIQSQPLLGSGAGSYYTAFPKYKQSDIRGFYDHAHNDYFQFIVEYGVVGFFLLLFLVGKALINALLAMTERRSLLFQALAFAPIMAGLALSLHSIVDFSLQLLANAAMFLLALSLAWIARYMPSRE